MGTNKQLTKQDDFEELLFANYAKEQLAVGELQRQKTEFASGLRSKLSNNTSKNSFPKLIWLVPAAIVTLVLLLFVNLQNFNPVNEIDTTTEEIDQTIAVLENYDEGFVEADLDLTGL